MKFKAHNRHFKLQIEKFRQPDKGKSKVAMQLHEKIGDEWKPLCVRVGDKNKIVRVSVSYRNSDKSDIEARRECITKLTSALPSFSENRGMRLRLWQAYYGMVDGQKPYQLATVSDLNTLIPQRADLSEEQTRVLSKIQSSLRQKGLPLERPKSFPSEEQISILENQEVKSAEKHAVTVS